jgi:hypothetical protein
MKTTKILILLLSILLLGAIFIYCPRPKPDVKIKTYKIYSEKTITELVPDLVIKEKLISKNDTIYLRDTILQIDTIFIMLDEHLARKFYSDTIFNNDTAFLVVNDTLYRNNIKDRSTVLKTYNKTITILQDNLLFIGGGINTYSDIKAGASYLKKNNLFTIEGQYRLMPDNERKLFVGFDYKRQINIKPWFRR